ncbi:MAG: tail fiber domain-containing protein [Verrucomicrobia bacterium]|jgi:hypothetical protein|nr:tail fiber domain-containing protein [Verrucomicrobiota bacterium]
MLQRLLRLASVPVLFFSLTMLPSPHAQGTTVFTYQGRLDSAGAPYSGAAEFRPTLWDAASSGNKVAGNGPFNSRGAAAIAVRNTAANKIWQWHVLDDGRMQLADFSLGATRLLIDTAGNVSALAFVPTSDRNAKEYFEPVDPAEILEKVAALPVSQWNFKDDAGARHIGPMAQDFHAAFGLGADDRHIATVDADGVALAAIQGLNQKLEERSRKLEAENAALRGELAELKQLVRTLAAQGKGAAR